MVLGRVVASLIGLALVAGPTAGCGTVDHLGSSTTPEVRVPAEFWPDFGGIRIGVQVEFEDDLRISAVHLRWSGESQRIGIYPLTGDDDPEPAPMSMDLDAGDPVLLEGDITPACGSATTSRPIFLVSVDGRIHQRFVPSNTPDLERAVATWCASPPVVRSNFVRSFPDGRYRVTLQVSNPGPAAAEVVLGSWAGARGSWDAARVHAPPGRVTELVVKGRGPTGCRVDAPWKDGHLLVDGRPQRLPLHEWCG